MFIIKVSLGNDIRRIAVEKLMSYSTLVQLIRNMFASELLDSNFVLRYTDDEGDDVLVSTDVELQEAYRLTEYSSVQVLRLFLEIVNKEKDVPELDFSFVQLPNEEIQVESEQAEPSEDNVSEPVKIEEPHVEENPASQETESSTDDTENDLNILETIEKQLQMAYEAVSKFVDSLELSSKFSSAVETAQERLRHASEKVDAVIIKPLTEVTKKKAEQFAEEVSKLQAEISRLKEQLRAELSKASESISNSGAAVPEAPAEEMKELKPAESEVELPPNAALADLQKLEDMGFTDRRRNLDLLAKHQGNLMSVVEELLR